MKTKKKHLWIYGPPSTGKSAMKLYFSKTMTISRGIHNRWWDEAILRPECGTVWLDEIQKGQLSNEMLNQLCDGDVMVNVKHGH
jgi:hypothetical protein